MLGILYSIASYGLFLASFTYFALFSNGILVPKTVDSGVSTSLAASVAVNLSLVFIFGLQHSVMARTGFKRALTRLIPPALERATYVLASSLALVLVMWQWQPIPSAIWHVENPPAAATLWFLNALGWLGAPASSFFIDHFDLFGIKQALEAFRRTTFDRKGFVTPLLYKYFRHPMMTALMVSLWVTPHMTAGHALLSLGMTAYVLIGVHFEERALAIEFGAEYQRYQATTPKFLPGLTRRQPIKPAT
jgi:protein-S-isoprenylcysteine O-methyltransferase Ste14